LRSEDRMNKKLDGQFVVPGEKLGVVEEFMPGSGTVEVEGNVYSTQTGRASLDLNRHIVTVKTVAGPPVLPVEGSTVIGVVQNAQEKMAIVNIITVDGKTLEPPFTGMLHISSASPKFERAMSDVCKPVDIIRAKVIDDSQRIPKLTTAGHGGNLVLSGRILRCDVCRNVERRRLADDFGTWTGGTN